MAKTAIFSISLSLIIFSSLSSTAAEMYVSTTGTDTASCGTIAAPCKTILQASVVAGAGNHVIKIATGNYEEQMRIDNTVGLAIQGGWNETFSNQSCNPEATKILSPVATSGPQFEIIALAGDIISVNFECLRITASGAGLWGVRVLAAGPGSTVTFTMRQTVVDSFVAHGIKIDTSDSSEIRATIEDTFIHHNQQTQTSYSGIGGAGINATSASGTIELDLKRNHITNNISRHTGGAILLQAEGTGVINARLENNIIADNQGTGGSGLYALDDGISGGNIDLTLTNNTITKNSSQGNGGGLYVYSQANTISVRLRNVIAWGNSTSCLTCDGADIYLNVPPGSSTDGSGMNIDYSIIGDVFIDSSSNYVDGGHNFNKDPKLSADSMLLSGSPAIDTGRCGNKIFVYSRIAPYDDIEGEKRPGFGQLTGCDIGADEYSSLHCFPVRNKQGGTSIICF